MLRPTRLTRRETIALGGALGMYVLTGCGSDDAGEAPRAGRGSDVCPLTPEQSEGPYYLERELMRSDIAEGRPGVPFELRLKVVDVDRCDPIENATVEVWHCDAEGVYSGVSGNSGTFCRGGQRSDADGNVVFHTLFPGWYSGRAVHIHVKTHVSGDEVHTGQIYFDEADVRRIHRREPYSLRGTPDTSNASDGLYSAGGAESTLIVDGGVGRLTLGVAIS